jgi:hypothetical protein
MAHGYPQTNLQLYRRLSKLGWADADIGTVKRGYEVAMLLHRGAYRSNGKPFVDHLVGTAGIIAEHGGSPTVVAAGLLHAAYETGSWPARLRSARAARALLASAIGTAAEDIVHQHTLVTWRPADLAGYRKDLDAAAERHRDVFAIRAANELELYLDLGAVYADRARTPEAVTRAEFAIEAASRVLPELATELAAAAEASRTASVPEDRRGDARATYLFPCLRPAGGPVRRLGGRALRALRLRGGRTGMRPR